jgi:hypothetical protein
MAKITGTEAAVELMVNCKTYPSVSAKYIETVCTGGVQPSGEFVRLYPIPYRFLNSSERYRRWEVIRVKAYRDDRDTRPESWRLEQGSRIESIDFISTECRRWEWMKKSVHESAAAMEAKGLTNGCVEIEPIEFYWEEDEKEWTPAQLSVFQQGMLFESADEMKSLADRVPWQFRLKYREKNTGLEGDKKVLQWSLYQGFRRERKNASSDEFALLAIAEKMRKRLFDTERTIFAILGTHSLSGHWMISAIYDLPSEVIEKDRRRPTLF